MRLVCSIISCLFLQICAAQLSFQDRASALGVGFSYGQSYLGGGVSFYDFDGDGWDDLTFATDENQEVLFFRNTGSTFEQVDFGINETFETKQVLWVDYDNDGDKDFFATSITGLNVFYQNNGDMTFTDITQTSGLYTENLFTYGATFGDIDNDGDLDLYIVHRDVTTLNQKNLLYKNEEGTYVDITDSAGLTSDNDLSFCASFFDYDNDGDQDLYVSNDKYTKINRLYKNNGDLTFQDVSVESGAGMAIDAMSTTIGDYNNDGWFDIYVTNTTQGNYHLRNNGDGTFTNEATELGTGFYSIAWGSVFLDAENDSDLDLYVSGMLDGSSGLPSAFYENENGLFVIPEDIGFDNDTRTSFSNAIGDINNDGYPDIVVMNDTDPNFLWQNNSTKSNNWLKVKLQGTTSNRDGIGSVIEVVASGKSQYRYTVCGEGYLGQNSGHEFFGLGNAETVTSLKITWLSGIIDVFENLEVNQSFIIIEGSGISNEGDADNDGVPDELDLCENTPANAVVNIDGCEIFSLPATNFMIRVIGESCVSSDNGSISLDAEEPLDYTATLIGNGENRTESFTQLMNMNGLAAGNYSLCVTVDGQDGYERCYDITIEEPESLSVSSKIDAVKNEITLNLRGGERYVIELNGKVYQTTDKQFTLPLNLNENNLLIRTDRACQGSYADQIFLNRQPLIFPNPVSGPELYIALEEELPESAFVELFATDGHRLEGLQYRIEQRLLTVKMDGINSGMYFLSLRTGNKVYNYKIIRR